MKCPNCSFENQEPATRCKVCGYDLTAKNQADASASNPASAPSDTPGNDSDIREGERIKHHFDESEDPTLDSTLDALFGRTQTVDVTLREKTPSEEKSPDRKPYPNAASEPEPKTERTSTSAAPTVPTAPAWLNEEEPEENKQIPETEDDDEEKPPIWASKNFRIVLLLVILAALLIFLLKSSLSAAPWHYDSGDAATTVAESTTAAGTTETSGTPEDAINAFFDALPGFVNDGSITILNVFVSGQQALDPLMAYAATGEFKGLIELTTEDFTLDGNMATYIVTSKIERLIDGVSEIQEETWAFNLVSDGSQWLIQTLSIGDGALDTTASSDSETQAQTTNAQTTTQTQTTTQAATQSTTVASSGEAPEGYLASGTFSGGYGTTGTDIASVRYGDNTTYKRLVLDFKNPDGTTADKCPDYSAVIGSDGKTLTLTVQSIANIASVNPKDLGGISAFTSTFPQDGSVQITITFEDASYYKVFDIKEPARLIIDYVN
jgi:hypothetical protein